MLEQLGLCLTHALPVDALAGRRVYIVYNNRIDEASWPVGEGSLAVEGDQPAGMRED